jgi:hypothetical protein
MRVVGAVDHEHRRGDRGECGGVVASRLEAQLVLPRLVVRHRVERRLVEGIRWQRVDHVRLVAIATVDGARGDVERARAREHERADGVSDRVLEREHRAPRVTDERRGAGHVLVDERAQIGDVLRDRERRLGALPRLEDAQRVGEQRRQAAGIARRAGAAVQHDDVCRAGRAMLANRHFSSWYFWTSRIRLRRDTLRSSAARVLLPLWRRIAAPIMRRSSASTAAGNDPVSAAGSSSEGA